MSSYLAVSPLPTTVETVAGGLLSVALFPDLAIGGRYPPSYPAESGLSSKERLATLSPRPSVRLLFFPFSKRNAKKRRSPTDAIRLFSIITSNAFFSTPNDRFFSFSRPVPADFTGVASDGAISAKRENYVNGASDAISAEYENYANGASGAISAKYENYANGVE